MATTGLAITAMGLAAACGGGDEAPPREVTADDLPMMVLQREDVPDQFRELDGAPARLSGTEIGFQAYLAQFMHPSEDTDIQSHRSEFGLSAEDAARGEAICITSFAVLMEDQNDWELAIFNSAEFTLELFHDVEDFEVEQVEVPNVGDVTIAFRLRSPSEDLCTEYDDHPAEAHVIYFTTRTVYAALIVWASDRGADLDEAVALAEKQAARIDAAFERSNND